MGGPCSSKPVFCRQCWEGKVALKGFAVHTFGGGSSEVSSIVQPLLLHLGGSLKPCVGVRWSLDHPSSQEGSSLSSVNVTALVKFQPPTGASLDQKRGLVWFPGLCRDRLLGCVCATCGLGIVKGHPVGPL